MANKLTTIDGYTVEFNPSNENGLTECHIWISGAGFLYSASLEALESEGILLDSWDREHNVHVKTIDKIVDWAKDQGYYGVKDQ